MRAFAEILDRALDQRSLDEAVVLLLAAVAAILALPFFALRAATGQWLLAGADVAVGLGALVAGLYCYRTGRARIAARGLIAFFLILLVAMVHLFGPVMLYWAYPVTAATFFLLHPVAAAIANALAALAVAGQATQLGPPMAVADFYTALLATNLLAWILASAMDRHRAQLTAMAEQDALTGVGNRRALTPIITAALYRIRRGTPASLLLLDVDYFKAINDTHGHETGDRVLVALARLIRNNVRTSDDVFRYGGEELVVLAHGAAAEAAGELAEKLRRRVAAEPLAGEIFVTVCFGVAQARLSDTPKSWFARADAMLYAAKRGGRNRVRVCAQAGADEPLEAGVGVHDATDA